MGFWDSARAVADRVIGSAANVTLAMDPRFVIPGQTVSVHIAIKNGSAGLEVRAVLLDIESVEEIDLPAIPGSIPVNWTNAVVSVAAAAISRKSVPAQAATQAVRHSERTFESTVTVAPGMKLSPGEEHKYKGTFRLPAGVQPTYQGKYAKHLWQVRARLNVVGVDPSTGWLSFRVGTPP